MHSQCRTLTTSVKMRKYLQTILEYNNNNYYYYTEITLYMCVCLDFKCDVTAIAFDRDGLCFYVFFCYQKSSEFGEMAIVSCKNCHNNKTKRFYKHLLIFV